MHILYCTNTNNIDWRTGEQNNSFEGVTIFIWSRDPWFYRGNAELTKINFT